MRHPRTLLKTLAILGPLAFAVSACAVEPAQAYDWCNGYYGPDCAYPYGPYAYDPYGYGDLDGGAFFSFGDHHDRFDHRFHDHHHFDRGGFHHGGFGHGGMGHGGFGHGGGHGH